MNWLPKLLIYFNSMPDAVELTYLAAKEKILGTRST